MDEQISRQRDRYVDKYYTDRQIDGQIDRQSVYNALCAGGKVMLLTNYTVTQFITWPLVRTTDRCFRLASEGAKCLYTHPPVYILRNNKELALYDSNWVF